MQRVGDFVITARCTVTDPAERARRLGRVYDLLTERGREAQRKTAVAGDILADEPTTAASDALPLRVECNGEFTS